LFSTHGLHAPTAQDLRWSGGVNAAYEIHVETLRTIAGLTGGRAIAANNAPTELVPAVFDELASYYALAYESSYPADGRRRWLQIDVARRDVMVMPSRVLITAARPRTAPAHHRLLDSARDSGLNDPISLSGVAIGRAESDAIAGRENLSGLLPFAPTAVRAFATNDRVGALLRIHQPTRRPAQPVTLLTEIVDGTGALVQASSRTIRADAFVDGAGVEHRVELPRGSLPAGSYLLRFVASTGPSRAQRDVRFEILP